MRTLWLILAFSFTAFIDWREQSISTWTWHFVVELWRFAELKLTEVTDFIYLIHAMQLAIY